MKRPDCYYRINLKEDNIAPIHERMSKLEKSNMNDWYVANNADELLYALKLKAARILITKYYKADFMEKTELPMSEESFFQTSRVAAGVGYSPVFMVMNWFEKRDRKQRRIDSKVQKYLLKEHGDDLILRLRQLYY